MKQLENLLFAAVLATAVGCAHRQDRLGRVASGKLTEARASWWGFDPADATDALQAAIDSGVPNLTVDNVGQPWRVRPIKLAGNQTITFEKGVVVEAKKGEFKGRGDSLFTASQKENIILRGAGATLRMHRSDYDNPELYEKAEWRHVLSIRSSKNVEVHGLTLALSGGDGIYLGVSKRGVTNENIVIKDVVCDRNYRQGISVISARNLLIENTIMKDTAGTPPAAGIDFEPNCPDEQLVNCVMRNCISENNQGKGYEFYLPNLHAESEPISILVENCISRNGNRTDFSFTTGNTEAETVAGRIDVVDCRFIGSRRSAVSIRRKPAAGAAVRFRNCAIENPAAEEATCIPVAIQGNPKCRRSLGGVDFGDMTVIDPVDRPFFDYEDWIGGSGITSVSGTFRVIRNGKETTTELTREWLEKMFPPRSYKQVAALSTKGLTLVPTKATASDPSTDASPAFVRKKGCFTVFASAGDKVSLVVNYGQVGRYGGKAISIVALSPSGKKIKVGSAPFKANTELSFTAPESGLFRLPIDAGPNKAAISSRTHGVSISGEDAPIRFIGPAGDLLFLVPAGTREFGVLLYGENKGEAIKGRVFDPSGRLIWEKDNITLPEMFAPDCAPAESDRIWRLQLCTPSQIACEDYYVDLRGIPPFLAKTPQALLTPER